MGQSLVERDKLPSDPNTELFPDRVGPGMVQQCVDIFGWQYIHCMDHMCT